MFLELNHNTFVTACNSHCPSSLCASTLPSNESGLMLNKKPPSDAHIVHRKSHIEFPNGQQNKTQGRARTPPHTHNKHHPTHERSADRASRRRQAPGGATNAVTRSGGVERWATSKMVVQPPRRQNTHPTRSTRPPRSNRTDHHKQEGASPAARPKHQQLPRQAHLKRGGPTPHSPRSRDRTDGSWQQRGPRPDCLPAPPPPTPPHDTLPTSAVTSTLW